MRQGADLRDGDNFEKSEVDETAGQANELFSFGIFVFFWVSDVVYDTMGDCFMVTFIGVTQVINDDRSRLFSNER